MNKKKPWDQQKKESPKQYYFFLQFIKIPEKITLPKFQEKMIIEGEEDDNFLYNIPTTKTFTNWSSDFKWFDRKKSFWKEILSTISKDIENISVNNLLKKIKLFDDIVLNLLSEMSIILLDDNFKGNKAWNIEKLANALYKIIQSQALLTGDPTEIIKTENENYNKNYDYNNEFEKIMDNGLKAIED